MEFNYENCQGNIFTIDNMQTECLKCNSGDRKKKFLLITSKYYIYFIFFRYRYIISFHACLVK